VLAVRNCSFDILVPQSTGMLAADLPGLGYDIDRGAVENLTLQRF
jgi:hypothetical protein